MIKKQEWILSKLQENDFDTQKVYSLYKDIKKHIPSYPRSTFERDVRRIKNKYAIPVSNKINETEYEMVEKGNEAELTIKTPSIKTLEELISYCNIDLNIWSIDRHIINKWDMGSKNLDGTTSTTPLFQVKAFLSKKIADKQKIPVIAPLNISFNNLSTSISRKVKSNKTTLIFGDAQIGFHKDLRTGKLLPYHDRKSLDLVQQINKDTQPNEILIIGDMLDCPEASDKFIKKPEYYFTFQPAIIEFAYFLSKLRYNNPKANITYMLGNHEQRVRNSIINNLIYAYDLRKFNSDIPIMSFKNLLDIEKLRINIMEDYPNSEYWINDNLKAIHGEFTSIKKELDVSKVSTIMGHLHRVEELSKTTKERYGNTVIRVASIGCLCDVTGKVPGSSSRPNWQKGICLVKSLENYFNLYHYFINGNKLLFDGQLYQGEDNTEEIENIIKL